MTVALIAVAVMAGSQAPIDCLHVLAPIEIREPVTITLTAEGSTTIGSAMLAFVRVVRADAPDVEFVRLLSPPPTREGLPTITFTFMRKGAHVLSVRRAAADGWPAKDETGEEVAQCRPQTVEARETPRPEFDDTRPHAWAAYRLATRVELGGSIFFQRLGIAALVSAESFPREPERNRVIPGVDLRWRGARGYLGGGVRYFPDREPDRWHWRPVAVIGEELPSLRGRPIWFLFDFRLDETDWQWAAWQLIDFSFGVRIDLAGKGH